VEDYWKNNTTDYFSEVPFCILYYFEGNETVNKFFISNKEQFIELYGKKDVQNVINDIVYKYFDQSIKHKNETEYEIAKKECYRLCTPEDAKIYINYYEKEYIIATENWSSLEKLISSQENELLINGEMNQICWTIFEECNDPNITKKASIWMKKLVTQSPSYASLDTYANLLFKIGDKKNGILQMEKAIEMGKKEGQNTSDCEKILKKFKNK